MKVCLLAGLLAALPGRAVAKGPAPARPANRQALRQRIPQSAAQPSREARRTLLVDRGSASASEIVTGALKDRGRAEVIGTRTFGKGLVQSIVPLGNNAALKLRHRAASLLQADDAFQSWL